jgi:thioredoxin-related protein
MQKYLTLLLVIISFNISAKVSSVMGGVAHEMPGWFKESFLEIEEDIAEANDENKHLMIFLHLNDCPYCAKMVEDLDANKDFVNKHFDAIALNIKGDREVAINEMETLTERELATRLGVQYTPTVIFLDKENNMVGRTNGYRKPERMQMMFDFIRNKNYQKSNFTNYVANLKTTNNYQFIANNLFKNINDLSKITKPLAIVFEDNSCFACEYFHTTTLKNKDILAELDKYQIVRLDAKSNQEIITPNGEKMKITDFVKELELTYRPGVVLFNKGQEIKRIDGFLYTFHFATMLRFVADGHYEDMSFGDYLAFRTNELTTQGVDVHIAQ